MLLFRGTLRELSGNILYRCPSPRGSREWRPCRRRATFTACAWTARGSATRSARAWRCGKVRFAGFGGFWGARGLKIRSFPLASSGAGARGRRGHVERRAARRPAAALDQEADAQVPPVPAARGRGWGPPGARGALAAPAAPLGRAVDARHGRRRRARRGARVHGGVRQLLGLAGTQCAASGVRCC